MEVIRLLWPVGGLLNGAPLCASHNRTVLPSDPDARTLLSWENTMEVIQCLNTILLNSPWQQVHASHVSCTLSQVSERQCLLLIKVSAMININDSGTRFAEPKGLAMRIEWEKS